MPVTRRPSQAPNLHDFDDFTGRPPAETGGEHPPVVPPMETGSAPDPVSGEAARYYQAVTREIVSGPF